MKAFLRSSLSIGTTAAQIANFSGAPFVGPVLVVLSELGKTCEQVQVHKAQIKHLLRQIHAIIEALQDGSSGLESSRLKDAADALENVLRSINSKLVQFSNWSFVRAYWKRDQVADVIQRSRQEIEAYKERFNIQAHLATAEKLAESQQLNQKDHEEMRTMLQQILSTQEHMRNILQMRQEGEGAAEDIMREAQTELHVHSRGSPTYTEFQDYVLNFHQVTGVMPTIPNLNQEIVRMEGPPIAGGTYSEVSKGLWLGKIEVALKSLREVKASEINARKRFEREIRVWHALEHENILRFLGIVDNASMSTHLCVVSPWQSNGNVLDYTKRNPNVDRLHLLLGAAQGIRYLHCRESPVVHGNIKCSNILVSDQGQALISDFGLARVMEEITEVSAYTTFTSSGGIRWLAPELMSENTSQTLATDIYAFAMSILECLTSAKPFAELRRDPHVVLSVIEKKRPSRPAEHVWNRWFTDSIWNLLERCWDHEPEARPSMPEVVDILSGHFNPVLLL
ncbi:hypothetical protein M422DRAFT_34989 [Sphaerobolus stellatus SS14]|uniref:Protein kinase domain-containing protein n=1 Tax=Sphaerobolus stellatus (strain SS14) TaxID=990650 RepID=A0A0C9VAW4_SPHS4|nr:hypothetical protein M422DRAFT_34989 [Sphaerobolus stellatus SS14]